MPVSSFNVTSVVCWHTTAVDNNTEDDEACAGQDFDHGEDEFN